MSSGAATAVVIFGVSGSGKTLIGSRLAAALDWCFVDADDLHPPANVRKMRDGTPLNDDDRWPWLDAVRERLDLNLTRQCPTVLACSALKRSYRERLAIDGRVRFFYLDVQRERLADRLRSRRGHFFNPVLLDSQLSTLEPPGASETVDANLPPEHIIEELRSRLILPGTATKLSR